MTARYWVLASEELMARDDLQWPDGLRVVGPASAPPPEPGMQWWQFEDDLAPATLEGKQVELTFVRNGTKTMIGTRRPSL